MENLAESFSHQFQDEKWVSKFLLGALFVILCMFLIPIPFVVGYMLQNVKNVIDRKKNPMPEWKNLGTMYIDGLKYFVATLGYMLPILLIIILMGAAITLMALIGDSDAAVLPALLFIPLQGLIMIYSILLAFITPILYIKMAMGEPYKNLYKFKEIFKFLKDNIGNILIVLLMGWAAGFIMNFGMLVFFVGIFPAAFYVGTIMAYLYGQLYLQRK